MLSSYIFFYQFTLKMINQTKLFKSIYALCSKEIKYVSPSHNRLISDIFNRKDPTEKDNSYNFLKQDVRTHLTNILAFEIGVRGNISAENRARLKTIHELYSKDIKLKVFVENMSALEP